MLIEQNDQLLVDRNNQVEAGAADADHADPAQNAQPAVNQAEDDEIGVYGLCIWLGVDTSD